MKKIIFLSFIFLFTLHLYGQSAILSDGNNNYSTIHEAFEAVEIFNEITLLEDIVLDAPLFVSENKHIILIPGNSSITIQRGVNNIDYPLIWITGENASLTLGKSAMEYELIIDGGNFNDPPILAHAPLITVNGKDSKLIMYDNVTLQNNNNIANVPTVHQYKNGAAVFIRTTEDDFRRQAEFIMKGGTIKGNKNDVKSYAARGGGVLISGFGIFTMEGGVIADNYAHFSGGGVFIDSMGTFIKTGGIIYGSNAPVELRNFAKLGNDIPRTLPLTHGHAVCIISGDFTLIFRDNTVNENETLVFTGAQFGNGIYNKAEEWQTSIKEFRLLLLIIILSFLIICASAFLIILRITLKKKINKSVRENTAQEIDISKFDLSVREKEFFDLLLTDSTIKHVAHSLGLTVSGVRFRAQNLYGKLGVKNRIELFAKFSRKKSVRQPD